MLDIVLVVLAVIFAVLIIILLIQMIRLNKAVNWLKTQEKKRKEGEVLLPFSEPRPGPEPTAPVRMSGSPVITSRDNRIKPIFYKFEQHYFERFYAPSDGQVTSVKVTVNGRVQKGDVVLCLNLGGTEGELVSSIDGVVRKLNVRPGSTFKKDDLLYVIQ